MARDEEITSEHSGLASFLDRMLAPRSRRIRQTDEAPVESSCCGAEDYRPLLSPGVLWEGIFSGYSGYAKAGRETMFRVANSMAVELRHSIKPPYDDEYQATRFALYEKFRVSKTCPYLRFFGPDRPVAVDQRPKICWTMMETETIHPDMIEQLNSKFDELWTPTHWNLRGFERSGLKIPGRVMPLGVDSVVYRPLGRAPLPPCSPLSSGERSSPDGFIFLSVGLPSFRKGFDVLTAAFEDAFSGDDSTSLVCAVTHSTDNVPALAALRKFKSRIYSLQGSYTEHQMAKIYSSCDAYVTASRGEGWNLPVCEAAACGLPVICPDATSHTEVAGAGAFMFKSEGVGIMPGAESVSPWYKGMPLTIFGNKSHDELVDLLRLVRKGGEEVERRARHLRTRMMIEWTWDNTARDVASRLLELQE